MKQLHNDLPDWALWLAQDADGAWWCYEAEPNQHGTGWYLCRAKNVTSHMCLFD